MPHFNKEKSKDINTDQLELETLGYQPITPKNLPGLESNY